MTRWIIAWTVVSTCLLGTGSAQAWYEGQIVDADTKEPIAGAVVFIEWLKSQFPGEGHYYVDAFETLTDEEGRFSLPRYWTWNLWKMAMSNHLITIFKSGYEPITGGYGLWREFTRQKGGVPLDTNVWKIERGRPVIMLKRVEDLLKRRELLRRVGPTAGVPPEKYILLRKEMEEEREIVIPK